MKCFISSAAPVIKKFELYLYISAEECGSASDYSRGVSEPIESTSEEKSESGVQFYRFSAVIFCPPRFGDFTWLVSIIIIVYLAPTVL